MKGSLSDHSPTDRDILVHWVLAARELVDGKTDFLNLVDATINAGRMLTASSESEVYLPYLEKMELELEMAITAVHAFHPDQIKKRRFDFDPNASDKNPLFRVRPTSKGRKNIEYLLLNHPYVQGARTRFNTHLLMYINHFLVEEIKKRNPKLDKWLTDDSIQKAISKWHKQSRRDFAPG